MPRKGTACDGRDVLSEAELESLRSTKWAGKSVFCFKIRIPPIFRPNGGEKESLMVPCMWRKARVREEEDGGEAGSLKKKERDIYMSLLLRPEFPVKATLCLRLLWRLPWQGRFGNGLVSMCR